MCKGPKPLKHKDIKPLREKLWKENGKICPICKSPVSENEIALDHSHDSTLIRNTICKKCNQIEGLYKQRWIRYGLKEVIDFPELLISLGEYLKQDHLPFIHPSEVPKSPKLQKRSYNKLVKEINKLNNYLEKKIKIPPYPKSKRMTKKLKELYKMVGIDPEYYSK